MKIKLTKTLLENAAKYDENENFFVYWLSTYENAIIGKQDLIRIILEAWTYKIDNENEPEIAPIAFVLGLKEKQLEKWLLLFSLDKNSYQDLSQTLVEQCNKPLKELYHLYKSMQTCLPTKGNVDPKDPLDYL